ncbi:MAG: ATP synthase F0 subunit B [Candidatus Eremiobacteraeota bacterium]|nr:ATP synthase F0 subunit B [Candidatus Eremiobacteraeota bacterium]MBV8280759.1 ATP synthase F0 subunit B [Candidatus Eremiobacteraeota bacterium]
MLLSFDGTLLVQILNFIVFWVLLNWLFIAPTRRAIEARQRFVADQYREADAFAAQAKQLHAQADGILNEARQETEATMRQASTRASEETHEIERTAAEEAAATVALAQAKVASERAEAVSKQGPFVAELAQTMASRALSADAAA